MLCARFSFQLDAPWSYFLDQNGLQCEAKIHPDNHATSGSNKERLGARLGVPNGAFWAPQIWKKSIWKAALMDVWINKAPETPSSWISNPILEDFCNHFGLIFFVCVLLLILVALSCVGCCTPRVWCILRVSHISKIPEFSDWLVPLDGNLLIPLVLGSCL